MYLWTTIYYMYITAQSHGLLQVILLPISVYDQIEQNPIRKKNLRYIFNGRVINL